MILIAVVLFFILPCILVVILKLLGVSTYFVTTTVVLYVSYGLIQDYRRRKGRREVWHIPSVPNWPFIGPLPYIRLKFFHESMMTWSKKLGPVFRIITAGDMFVFVSSYEAIRQVCITKGKETGGRPMPFLTKYMLNGTGILFSHQPDSTWKSLRMASQKHLKQFGEGLSHLQDVISDVAENMFTTFNDKGTQQASLDPKRTIFDTALITISYLITGVRHTPGEEIVEDMREYENIVLKFIGATKDIRFTQYDRRPWLRHLPIGTWKTVEGVRTLQDSIWREVQELNKQYPDSKSLFKVLSAYVPGNNVAKDDVGTVKGSQIEYSEDDVKMTVLSLLLAGVTTTSASFYAIVNILAHRPHIQDNLFEELKKVRRVTEPVHLADRQDMPYCRAVLFELLRYASVVPVGVPHRTVTDVEIVGIKIPHDTVIATNLWAMHHDREFWKDPYEFRPERFIADDGTLVTADHPNRKHLMPFGAGPRVCLGESLALARLFLWIATLAQRFQVVPAEGNTKDLTDCRKYEFDGVVRICPYKVNILRRDTFNQ